MSEIKPPDATVTVTAPSRAALVEALREVLRNAERGIWFNECWWVGGAYHRLEVKSEREAALRALQEPIPAARPASEEGE